MSKSSDSIIPVVETAGFTLGLLAEAGIPEAIKIKNELGKESLNQKYDVDRNNTDFINQLIQESSYTFINNQIREAQIKNVVDLGCGFSPRGQVLSKEGYNYYGIDLEPVIQEMNPLADKFRRYEKPSGSLSYIAVDITNPQALTSVFSQIDGEVFIVCENLFMFIQSFELEETLTALQKVLTNKEGYFLSPDFSLSKIYSDAYISALGIIRGLNNLHSMQHAISYVTNIDSRNLIINKKKKDIDEYLTGKGFLISYVKFHDHDDSFMSLNHFAPKSKSMILSKFSKIKCYKLTCKRAASAGDLVSQNNQNCSNAQSIDCFCRDEVLHINLRGRVDSTNAAVFLKKVEEAFLNTDIRYTKIGMEELTYISSAGLRVIAILAKKLGSENVRVSNMNDVVLEIFETTGFAQLITKEE